MQSPKGVQTRAMLADIIMCGGLHAVCFVRKEERVPGVFNAQGGWGISCVGDAMPLAVDICSRDCRELAGSVPCGGCSISRLACRCFLEDKVHTSRRGSLPAIIEFDTSFYFAWVVCLCACVSKPDHPLGHSNIH